MRKFSTLASAVLLGSLINGCSNSPNEDLYERLEALEKHRSERVEDYQEQEQVKREEEVDIAPKWYLNPPQSDATGVFGVGMYESKSLSFAIKGARLQAEFQLAKMLRQELSGSERIFEQSSTGSTPSNRTTFLIDKLVDAVPVVGYELVEQKFKQLRGNHNVYVLLKLPYDEFNRVLIQEKEKALDEKVQDSFDDLERRLDKRRSQRLEEKSLEYQWKQEALKHSSENISGKGVVKEQDQGIAKTKIHKA